MVYLNSAANQTSALNRPVQQNQHALSEFIIMFWLYGMVIFLPVKIFHFPFNMELVDIWIVLVFPVLWISIILGWQSNISMTYIFPMILILLGSFASTFAATDPSRCLIVVLKEVYLFVWFITVAVILSGLSSENLRRLMAVWAGVVVLHGALIIAQFAFPEIWRMSAHFAGQPAAYAHFRPSGLFLSEKAGDANKAAFFQLTGFVPLILARPQKRVAMIMAMILFCSILATGSMGTTGAFTAGLITALVTISIYDKNLIVFKKILTQLIIAITLLVAVFTIVLSQSQSYRSHFEKIIAGRAEKSSGGRFHLWQRGIDAFVDHNVFIWGVGPENFREVDPSGNDNQLHNDFLAFTVERGLIAVIGLVLIAFIAISRAVYLLKTYTRNKRESGLYVVVFLAMFASAMLVSLTHQIFHARELWLVLAVQEAMVFKTRVAA